MSITPPYTTKLSEESSIKSPSPDKSEKQGVVNRYLKESSILITSLWLNSSNAGGSAIKSTDFEKFLREIVKRSRCSLHILQLAIYYLFKLQVSIKKGLTNLQCPKKVFLICLILSFKFSFDSNYKFKTWTKISGLDLRTLKSLEMNILGYLNYELNISKEDYDIWIDSLECSLNKIEDSYKMVKKRCLESDFDARKRICV